MTDHERAAGAGEPRRSGAAAGRKQMTATNFGVRSSLTRAGACHTSREMARNPNFVTLWIIVSGLWLVATFLRIQRVWVPGLGWPAVLNSTFTWISLLVPPPLFAIVLAAMSRIAARPISRTPRP